MDAKKPKIILIGGYTRSGSTLLDRVLGTSPQMFSVGELCFIWEHGFLNNHLCGCGIMFSECVFWNTVINKWSAGINNFQIKQILEAQRYIKRFRAIPALLFPKLRTRSQNNAYENCTQPLLELYQAIQAQSGCEIIVDSSKDPSYVYLLNSMAKRGEIDLFVIHLVRDSRAVAYSWQRQKIKPEIHWKKENMPINSVSRSAFEWVTANFFMDLFRFFSNRRYIFLRIEDFIANPYISLKKISELLQISLEDIYIPGAEQEVELGENHTVSGNPMRFQQGTIRIQPDNDWMNLLSTSKKWLVAFITLPWLIFYRYRL